jgi:hypothetical protein
MFLEIVAIPQFHTLYNIHIDFDNLYHIFNGHRFRVFQERDKYIFQLFLLGSNRGVYGGNRPPVKIE